MIMYFISYFFDASAGPDSSFDPVVARNSEVLDSNPGRVGCLALGWYIYCAINCSKSFNKSRS